MGAVSGPGSGAGTLAQPGSTSTGASLAGSTTKAPTDNADNTQGQNLTAAQRAAAMGQTSTATASPGQANITVGGSLTGNSIFSSLNPTPTTEPTLTAPVTASVLAAPTSITPPITPESFTSYYGSSATKELTGDAATQYAQSNGLTPQQLQQYQQTGSVTLTASPVSFLNQATGQTESYTGIQTPSTLPPNSLTGQAATSYLQTQGGTPDQVAQYKATGMVTLTPSPTLFTNGATGGTSSYTGISTLPTPVTSPGYQPTSSVTSSSGVIIGGTPATVPTGIVPGSVVQNDLYNYTVTVKLADGQTIPNVSVNVPTTYLPELMAQGTASPIISEIALGNLNGATLSYGPATTTASATPTAVLGGIGLNLAEGQPLLTYTRSTPFSFSIGGTSTGNTASYFSGDIGQTIHNVNLPIVYNSLANAPEGFTSPTGGITNTYTSGEYTYTFDPANSEISVTQGGQQVATVATTPAQGITANSYAAALGSALYSAQPGQSYITVAGQQIPISFTPANPRVVTPSQASGPLAFLEAQAAAQQQPSAQLLQVLGQSPKNQTLQLTQSNAGLSQEQQSNLLQALTTIFGSPLLAASAYNNNVSKNLNNYLQNINSPDYAAQVQALQQLSQQSEQNTPIPGTGYNINTIPQSIDYAALATALSVPGFLQNLIAEANKVGGNAYQFVTGQQPTQYVPFNRAGAYITNNLGTAANFVPSLIHQIPNTGYGTGIGRIGLQTAVGVPIEGLTAAAQGISNPNTTPFQYAVDLAALASSIAAPGRAVQFGLGAEAFGNALEYLLGHGVNPAQSAANYQFGAATVPVFQGINAAGEALGLEGLAGKAFTGIGSAAANLGLTNAASYAQAGTAAPLTSDIIAAGLPLGFELNPFGVALRSVPTPASEEATNILSEEAEGAKQTNAETGKTSKVSLSQATQEAGLGNPDLFPRARTLALLVGFGKEPTEIPIVSIGTEGQRIQLGSFEFADPDSIVVSKKLSNVNNASPFSEGTMTIVKSYLKNLAAATGSDSWQTQIGKLGVSLAGTFRDAVLPPFAEGLKLAGLTDDQNAVINEAVSNPSAVIAGIAGRIYGTASVIFQLGSDFRLPHDIDVKITTDTPELANTFAERFAAALTAVGEGVFTSKDNIVFGSDGEKILEVKTNIARPEDIEGALQEKPGLKLGYQAERGTVTTPQGANIAPLGETILGKLSSALGIRWTENPTTGEDEITLNSAAKRGDTSGSKDYADAIAIMQRYLESSKEAAGPNIMQPTDLLAKLEQFKQLAIDHGLVTQEKIDESLNNLNKNGIQSSYTPPQAESIASRTATGGYVVPSPAGSAVSIASPSASSGLVQSVAPSTPSSSLLYAPSASVSSPLVSPSPSVLSSIASPSPSAYSSPSTSLSRSVSPSISISPSPYVSPYGSPYFSSSSPYFSPSVSVSPSPSISPYISPSPSYMTSPSLIPSTISSYVSSPTYSGSSGSPYIPNPLPTKKPIPITPPFRQAPPTKLPPTTEPALAYQTQYAPSLTTTLIPQLTPNITNPDTAILGVGLRGAYQAPGLDNPTSGVPTPSDTALQQAIQNAQLGAISPNLLSTPPQTASQPQSLANAQITQENANLTQPATPSSPSYLQNPQYYGELEQSLLQQQNANLVQDASRNYQNSLFGQGILQNLGQGMSFTDLQALIKSQEDLANAQYNAQSQPSLAEEAANIPSAYANQNVYAQVPAEVRRRLEDVGVEVPQPAYA